MTPSSILKGTAVLLFLQGISTVVLGLMGIKFPAALLGMILLLVLLLTGVINVRTIEGVCDILIEKMGMLFLPAGVSILLYIDVILAESTAIIATIIISSFMILIVTALFLSFMLRDKGGDAK